MSVSSPAAYFGAQTARKRRNPSEDAEIDAYFKRHLSRIKPQNASAYIFQWQVTPYCFKSEFFTRVCSNLDLRAKNRAGQTPKCVPFFRGVAATKFRPDLCLQQLKWLFFFFFYNSGSALHTQSVRPDAFSFLTTTHDLRTICIQTHLRWIQLLLFFFCCALTASRSRFSAAESGFNLRCRPRCQ